jgi:hypothetical protein
MDVRGDEPRIFHFQPSEDIIMQWKYITHMDAPACMVRLSDPGVGSVDELNPFRVEVSGLSDSHLYMVYRGRRFSKDRRTEFIISVLPDEAFPGAKIIVEFKRELFNIPYPMTPITELDEFMKLTLNASRIS